MSKATKIFLLIVVFFWIIILIVEILSPTPSQPVAPKLENIPDICYDNNCKWDSEHQMWKYKSWDSEYFHNRSWCLYWCKTKQ